MRGLAWGLRAVAFESLLPWRPHRRFKKPIGRSLAELDFFF
jgi:hypothetical protein